MKKIRQVFKQLPPSRKVRVYLICLLLVATSLVTGTRAWTAVSQQALNTGQTKIEKKAVHLLKLEKNSESEATKNPIEGAKFYLYQVKQPTDEQIGSVYTTDKAGKIPVTLAPGGYYFEEFDPSPGYTFDTDKEGKTIKRYPFTVTPASSNEEAIALAYNQRQSGSLEIGKEVLNEDGSALSAEQKKHLFEFQVTFSDGGTYSYQVDGGKKTPLKSGESLSLTHGQQAVFEKIPQGVHYVVTEKPVLGYQAQADNTSGNITEKVSTVHFVNTYAPQRGQLDISKEIINGDGTEVTEGQQKLDFEFKLSLSDEKNAYNFTTNTGRKGSLKDGDRFTLQHDEVLSLHDLPIGLTYKITETPVTDYTASPSEYKGTMASKEKVTLPFINQYLTDTDKTGRLTFGKQVVAETIDLDQVFSFKLTFSDDGTYLYQLGDNTYSHQSGELIYLKHDEEVTFSELPAGISYQLVETPVEEYQAQLLEVTGTILSDQDSHFTFYNHQVEKGSLVLEKIGLGEGFDKQQDFSFNLWLNGKKQKEPVILKAGESSEPIELTLGDTWRVEEINLAEEGYHQTSLVNGTGTITKANQTVTVSQTNTSTKKPMKKITGEKHWRLPEGSDISLPETITVQVKAGEVVVASQDVKGPAWQYEFDLPKYNDQGEEIDYQLKELPVADFTPVYDEASFDITNVYRKPVTLHPLKVVKRLTGDKPISTETFEFRLNPSQQLLKIDGAGEGQFTPLVFNQAGTYTYTISERNKGTLGYTYDPAVYTWTVVVEEKDHQLVVASESMTKDGNAYEGKNLVFDNHFNKKELVHEKTTIKGLKTWQHGSQSKDKRPDRLTVLLRSNGKVAYQQEVTAENEWRYSFTVNTYDEDGQKINYTIDEVGVPDYKLTVKGYDLINTYVGKPVDQGQGKPKEPGKKPGQRLPQSGEQRAVILIAVGGLFIISSLVLFKSLRRKQP